MTKRTKADYESAIANSPTMSGALRILGLKPSGGNFSVLKKKAAEYGISLKFSPSIPLTRKPKTQAIQPSELFVLSESAIVSSRYLKNRFINLPTTKHECAICGFSEWFGKKLNLQLDHTNGNNLDNRLENLRLLCPNCHSQTSTFAGRNKRGKPFRRKPCKTCHAQIKLDRIYCKECFLKKETKRITMPLPSG